MLLCLASLAGGLGGGALAAASARPAASGGSGVTTSGISKAECAKNRAAGPITFETSFDYAAAASILDVVVAYDRNYFKDMCLTVNLIPGFSTTNVADVSANKVQVSSLGSNSEVIAAVREQANLVGVATYGNTAISELILPGNSTVTKLKQLDGKPVGIKGALPYEVAAMLRQQGVDISSLQQIQVGFNPAIIDQGRIDALPVYKSNEPFELKQLGLAFKVFDPTTYHISASFAAVVANRSWAKQNPTAMEDFLRADIEAFNWAVKHPTLAVADTQARIASYLGISTSLSRFRWRVESGLCVKYSPAGMPFGMVDLQKAKYEYAQDRRLALIGPGVDLNTAFDNSYIQAIYNGTTLVWPSQYS